VTVYVCSLSATPDQLIQPNTDTLLVFPFDQDQIDHYGMHEPLQPDGITVASDDQRAGLIWPYCDGWGHLTAEVQWEAGGYTELRDLFMRDPLGFTSDPMNDTARDDRVPSGGYQYFTKHHELAVYPGTPLGFMVRHNDKVPRRVLYAQFKLAIHPW
jgi:hypothetical protein